MNEAKKTEEGLFILRFYDMLDGWLGMSKPMSKAAADALWDKETSGGTKNAKYADGDYYCVFPADTRMVHTPEFRGR